MATILLLPGYMGTGPDHWLSLWERSMHGSLRVQQDDWEHPSREAWITRLDLVIRSTSEPPVLAAHSLGALLAVHWAAEHDAPVAGALLVAPPDVERPDALEALRGFAPVPMRPLPFPSIVVTSTDDPYVEPSRARAFADAWGSRFVSVERAGHLNSDAGYGPWPQGERLLEELLWKGS